MARITVFPKKRLSGWNGDPDRLGDTGFGDIRNLREALETSYHTDAHAVQYAVPGRDRMPRLNQSSLGYLQRQPDAMVRLEAVFIDIDFPDHDSDRYGWSNIREWPERWEDWRSNVERAFDQCPEIGHAGWYLTRGGMRLVWPLASNRMILVRRGSPFLEQFYDYLANTSLPHDRLTDWNRFFRLPDVVRDGTPTEPRLHLENMEPLDWRPPEPLHSVDRAVSGEATRSSRPDWDDIDDPLVSDLKPLEGRWYHGCLKKGLPLADPAEESRHNQTVQAAASIVQILETTDPLEVLQLLKPSIDAMLAQQTPADRTFTVEEAWKICVWCCEQYDGQQQQNAAHEKDFLERQADAIGCDPEEVRNHLILYTTTGGSYFVWDEYDQSYSVQSTQQNQLLALLSQHCPELSRVASLDDTGASRLLQQYGTAVSEVTYSYIADAFEYDPRLRTLRVPVLEQDPTLDATYHEEVHGWLEALFANRVEKGLDWLATMLRFDRMTCALYLHGPPNVGKSLLSAGICRLWRTSPADYTELSDDFQSALLDSPLVVAEEGMERNQFHETGSKLFRRVTGRSRQKIEKKFQDKADLEGSPRILITANDDDAVQTGESLQPNDIEALRQRIGYIHTNTDARDYLDEVSGEEPVQDLTTRWVEDGLIAEHILWLHEHRDVEIGDRFLVEGWESDLTTNLIFQFGAAPEILRFVTSALRDRSNSQAIHVDEEGVWVTIGKMADDYQRVVSGHLEEPRHGEFIDVLKTLSNGKKKPMAIQEGSEQVDRWFWCLDAEDVARSADYFHTGVSSEIKKVIEKRAKESEFDPENNIIAQFDTKETTG